MQELKCPSCGEQSAIVIPKRKLEKFTKSSTINKAGKIEITPEHIIEIFKIAFNQVFGWFADNDQKYVVCKSCGHYEKLD